MVRLVSIGALAFVLSLGAVLDAGADPLLDPIVRTRGGSIGSVPIFSLPAFFDFYPDDTASFPDLPTNPVFASSCITGTTDGTTDDFPEFSEDLDFLTCEFENHTSSAITSLNFTFDIPGDTSSLIFQALDPDGFFSIEGIDENGALFAGGTGIPACGAIGEGGFCFEPFHFLVDFYGFPVGTRMTMTAAEADAVPEPATLTLFGTGLVLVAGRLRRRRR